jgi:hypothetical protein
MSFTFDPALSTARDWLRADLGDTETATALLSDEQIAAVLAAELACADGSRHTAKLCLAAQCVAVIVRDPIKVDAAGAVTDSSDRLKALEPLAAQWRLIEAQRAAATTVAPSQARPTSTSVRVRGVW